MKIVHFQIFSWQEGKVDRLTEPYSVRLSITVLF